MFSTRTCSITTASLLLLGALVGCDAEPAAKQTTNASNAAELPASLFLTETPTGATMLADAKKSAHAGDTVVVTGRVGGRAEPFLPDRAVFFLVDSSLLSCDQMAGDSCPKPWDYCCEAKDNLLAHMATVQIVDEQGRPLPVSLENHPTLHPLDTVSIVGTVQEVTESGTFVVNATGIYVQES